MFGFSPCMMAAERKPPFVFGGTFASDLDGWVAGGSAGRVTSPVRTSPGAVRLESGSDYIEYTVPGSVCEGLTITASIWHVRNSGTPTRELSYKIGSGSFVPLATVTDASATFAEMTGTFDNPGNYDVTIRVHQSTTGRTILDDWSISGV